MITSEVLNAIDNINDITIESEISMCESLLSSYDKMSLLEEYYEGDDINGFKIFQEASKMDLVKEDLKKQNEGKSTLNKIIFTIPRLIRSLLRLIMGKLKKTTSLVESIKGDVNSSNEKSKTNGHIVQTTTLYGVLGIMGTGGIYAGVKGFKQLKEYIKEKKNNKQTPNKDNTDEASKMSKKNMDDIMDSLKAIKELTNEDSDEAEVEKKKSEELREKAEQTKKQVEDEETRKKVEQTKKNVEADKALIDNKEAEINSHIEKIRDVIPEDLLKELNINLDNIKTSKDIENIIQLIKKKELEDATRKMNNETYDLSILKPVKDFFSNLSDESFEKYENEYTRLIDQINKRHEKKLHRSDGSYEVDVSTKPNIIIFKNQVVINMHMQYLKLIIKDIKNDIDDINNEVKHNNIDFELLTEKNITDGAKSKIYVIYKNGLELTSLNESFSIINDKTILDSVSEMNQSFEKMIDNVNNASLSNDDKEIIRSNITDIDLRIRVVEMAIDDYNDLCSIHKNFQDMCKEANIKFEKSANSAQSINNTSSKTIIKADAINDVNNKQIKKSDIPKEEKEFKEFINKGKAADCKFDDFNKFYLNNTYTKYEFDLKNEAEIAKANELKKKYILDPLSNNFSTEVIKSAYDLDKAHRRSFIEAYNYVTKNIAQCLSDNHTETDIDILNQESKKLCEFIDKTTNPKYDYKKWL